ncbi:MAG: xanthine dehydrogenase accessory factor [Oleiphilaceae bacterium]|jgi:xanthine dehydrogenase accessory factor
MHKKYWADAAQQSQAKGEAYALVTVLGCTGSTPRDQSSKMVVTQEHTYDTIGGGNLEFVVTNKARELLTQNLTSQEIIPFPLGGSLGQCCGGNATVLLETFAACQFQVALFGAGHVAKALVNILAGLPCKVQWIDKRENMFPADLPGNVTTFKHDDPASLIAALPTQSDVLILTHNHQLDYALTVAAIHHGKLRHIGLIGSKTKAKRFQQRFAKDGLSKEQTKRIICPVGLSTIPGKLPMEVAVSIAAELIAIEHAGDSQSLHRGLAWTDIKQTLCSAREKSNSNTP